MHACVSERARMCTGSDSGTDAMAHTLHMPHMCSHVGRIGAIGGPS